MLDLARLHLALAGLGSACLGLGWLRFGALRNALSLWAANEPLSRLYRMLATAAVAVTFVVSIVVVVVRSKDNA